MPSLRAVFPQLPLPDLGKNNNEKVERRDQEGLPTSSWLLPHVCLSVCLHSLPLSDSPILPTPCMCLGAPNFRLPHLDHLIHICSFCMLPSTATS